MHSFQWEKTLLELNLAYDNNRKKFHILEYLGSYLNANLSWEPIAMKYLREINAKLEFLDYVDKFLNSKLRRLVCSSSIQPHFDYVFSFVPFS